MCYYIRTKKHGEIRNKNDAIIVFNSYSDARHWGINHLDLSDTCIEILQVPECYHLVEEVKI